MGNQVRATGWSESNRAIVLFYTISLLFCFMQVPAIGQMETLSDTEMDGVTAQSGVSVLISGYQFDWAAGYLTFFDSDYDPVVDPNDGTISFTGMRMINGVVETNKAITWDAYTIDDAGHPMDGRTFTSWQSPDLYQLLNLTVDDVAICGHSTGELAIDNFTTPQRYFTMGAHGSGMDFQHAFQMHTDRLAFTYNTSGISDTFELYGIHLVVGFDDMADFDINDSTTWDIPTDTSLWTSSGVFSIGDIDGGNPATLDIGTAAGGQTVIRLELPMSGSLRVENLQFGGNDFGPLAIDGLQVHRLTLTIPGGI